MTDQTRPFSPQRGADPCLPIPGQHTTCTRFFLRTGVLLAAMLLAGANADAQISPFTTDGCSEFPEGTPRHRQIWRDCCVAHDRAYWRGGTRDERLKADMALEACVAEVGEPAIARLMLAGVRVGGSPWWPTPYRWGYGWPWPRGYEPLTPEEHEQADQVLSNVPASTP